jgi:hypothetical protein
VGCDAKPLEGGALYCAECSTEADEKVAQWSGGNAQPLTLRGELARLLWTAKACGIDVKAVLAVEIGKRCEESWLRLKTDHFAKMGIEYVRGKPLPEPLRSALRDAHARRYLRLRQEGVRGCARQVLASSHGLFESEADVRQQAKRVKDRDEKP